MLRKLRIALAAIFLIAITLLFVGITGFSQYFGWMAKIQFLPAVLAVNIGIVVLLLVLTLVFGRVYCSIICPMGVYQDIISNVSARRKGKKRRFKFTKEHKILRYGTLLLFIISLIAGINVIVALLSPYSSYGRAIRSIAGLGDPWGSNWITAAIALALIVLIGVLAWIGGRTWCNNICPVGTVLGLFSRFAIFRPVIDKSKCKACHSCEKQCKASCIDSAKQTIDGSRCVACFDCIEDCHFGAISFRPVFKSKVHADASEEHADVAHKTEDGNNGRRAFIVSSAIAATSLSLKAEGLGETLLKERGKVKRNTPVVPFGAKSLANLHLHCTACQLCVSVCPNKVLRPSTDLNRLMQPEMSFEHGYCRPECTLCSEVCPTKAIEKITAEEKTAIHIGIASVDRNLCVIEKDGVNCGNCARHCPAGAISMLKSNDGNGPRIPVVDENKCIGCGACEHLCPSRPISAIKVDGRRVHVVD